MIPIKRWIIHSTVQNFISLLPHKLSYKVYFWVQRKFGRLHTINTKDCLSYLERSVLLNQYFKKYQKQSKVAFELGTGRIITTLIGLWILGYKKIITVDLNPYLSADLIHNNIQSIIKNTNDVFGLFKNDIDKEEFDEKISILSKLENKNMKEILETLNIQYIPYQDARSLTTIENSTIDIYFSNQVLEHIPYLVLDKIFNEGKRVITKGGLFIHFIGLHDHFSTIDSTISGINFLKFSNFRWNLLAGNKFMYQNRLRASDYYKLFQENDFQIVEKEAQIDSRSLEELENGFRINRQFKNYAKEDIATTALTIISKNNIA